MLKQLYPEDEIDTRIEQINDNRKLVIFVYLFQRWIRITTLCTVQINYTNLDIGTIIQKLDLYFNIFSKNYFTGSKIIVIL